MYGVMFEYSMATWCSAPAAVHTANLNFAVCCTAAQVHRPGRLRLDVWLFSFVDFILSRRRHSRVPR